MTLCTVLSADAGEVLGEKCRCRKTPRCDRAKLRERANVRQTFPHGPM